MSSLRSSVAILCIASSLAIGQFSADCDLDGTPDTILDALEVARIAAALTMPMPTQLSVCDVDGSASVNILDGLVIAQYAAGLPPVCGSAPTVTVQAPLAGQLSNPFEVRFDLDDPCNAGVDHFLEVSFDAGASWMRLGQAANSPVNNPGSTACMPATISYMADLRLVAPPQGLSGPVELRITASNASTQVVEQVTGCTVDVPGTGQDFLGMPITGNSVVIVVDCSDVMAQGGICVDPQVGAPPLPFGPWPAIQVSLVDTINGLDPATNFGVVLFNQSSSTWNSALQPASAANKTACSNWVMQQQCQGTRDFTGAMSTALTLGGSAPDQVILLGAGDPDEGYAAVGNITAMNNGQTQIDTIDLRGLTLVYQVLTDIASGNGGSFIYQP